MHHGCVAAPDAFWTQSIAAIGTKFDLSKVEVCHMGTDGDGWCKHCTEFFPARVKSTGHLDPFHVNRAVLSCFDRENARGTWHVLDVLNDGDKEEACKLLELMRDSGVARERRSTEDTGGRFRCIISQIIKQRGWPSVLDDDVLGPTPRVRPPHPVRHPQ